MKTHDLICEIKLTVNSEKFGKKKEYFKLWLP